jgi:hypothetical protein
MASKIEQHVMASVAVISTTRRLVSVTALKLYASLLALYAVGQLVWVQRVFENLEKVGMQGALNFMVSAVLHTEFLVQVTLVVLIAAVVSLMHDLLARTPSYRAVA